jgi:hypothetical protein
MEVIEMKLYLVKGYWENKDSEGTMLYGVFSTMEKAIEIRDQMEKNIEEHNEEDEEEVVIEIVTLDEPTDNYYFMIYN